MFSVFMKKCVHLGVNIARKALVKKSISKHMFRPSMRNYVHSLVNTVRKASVPNST